MIRCHARHSPVDLLESLMPRASPPTTSAYEPTAFKSMHEAIGRWRCRRVCRAQHILQGAQTIGSLHLHRRRCESGRRPQHHTRPPGSKKAAAMVEAQRIGNVQSIMVHGGANSGQQHSSVTKTAQHTTSRKYSGPTTGEGRHGSTWTPRMQGRWHARQLAPQLLRLAAPAPYNWMAGRMLCPLYRRAHRL
jgi:hypothetical protein